MLRAEGLSEINTLVLQAARSNRFLDLRGITVVGASTESGSKKIIKTLKITKKCVRKHRLFAKTKEAKLEIERDLLELTKKLSQRL